MRWRLPETITFTLKIISVFSSNKVKIVLVQPWCLSLPWALCKPWGALRWIHAWRHWKRKTLHHLKENKIRCLNAWEQQLMQLAVSMQQPSIVPCNKVSIIFSWDVTRDSAESPDTMEGAASGWVDLSLCFANWAKALWNLELTLPEETSLMCGAVQGDVLVEDRVFLIQRPQPVESL